MGTGGERRTLRVDAAAILEALTARDADILGSYLDLRTGAVFQLVDPVSSGQDNEAIEAAMDQEPDRYATIPMFDREYRLMCSFAEDVEDEALATALDGALRGQNAFRRFQHEVVTHAAAEDWRGYRQGALVKWALDWLHSIGIAPDWELPAPAVGRDEGTGLFHLLLLGRIERDGEQVRKTVHLPASGDARRLFRRAARELCAFRGEPWRARYVRDNAVFEREGVRLRWQGPTVTLEVQVDSEIQDLFGEG